MKQSVAFALLLIHMCQGGRISREVGDKCTTPNNEAGECRNVKNCPVLLDFVKSNSTNGNTLLRESLCGFQGSDSLVCCPELSSRQTPWLTSGQSQWGFTSTSRPRPSGSRPSGSEDSGQCGRRSSAAHAQVDNKIVGGEDAALGSWPWLAALGYRSRSRQGVQWLCGGALVTSRHVVTAAHCVVIPADKTLSLVRLGDLDLDDEVSDGASPEDIPVESASAHNEYESSAKVNDIAIVTLRNSVRYTDHIRPICLPTSSQFRSDSLIGQSPYVAGWGAVFFRGPSSKTLQQVDVSVTDEASCQQAYATQRGAVIDRRVICAGRNGKDACQGDSGGPFMLDRNGAFYLVGVVSYGKNCAEPGFPGVYTRVSSFVDWINNRIN